MQLAWDILETARVIWERHGEEGHLSELADVHLTLGGQTRAPPTHSPLHDMPHHSFRPDCVT